MQDPANGVRGHPAITHKAAVLRNGPACLGHHAQRHQTSRTVRRENYQPPVHHFLRECSQISLTTDSLLVVSRHASLYSKVINHYHRLSPFPAGIQIRYSIQHYRLASGIVKPAVQISLHHPRTEGRMIIFRILGLIISGLE